MLAPVELVTFITTMVKNFINFPPLAITIVATLGIGIAEGSGFIQVMLKNAQRHSTAYFNASGRLYRCG